MTMNRRSAGAGARAATVALTLALSMTATGAGAQTTGTLPPPWHPAAGLWSVTIGGPFGPMKAMMCTDGKAAPDPFGSEQDNRNTWRKSRCSFEPVRRAGEAQVYQGKCTLGSGTTQDITISIEGGDFSKSFKYSEKLIVKSGGMAPNEVLTVHEGKRVGDCGSGGNRLKAGQFQAIDGGEPQNMKTVQP